MTTPNQVDDLPEWDTSLQQAYDPAAKTLRVTIRPPAASKSVDDLPEWEAPPPAHWPRQVGVGEAAAAGIKSGLTFGAAPAMAGVAEASGVPSSEPAATPEEARRHLYEQGNESGRFFVGAGRMLANYFSNHPDPSVTEAYHRGREEALQNQEQSAEQHPVAYYSGLLGGSLLTPSFGAAGVAGGAKLGTNVIRGTGAGMTAGGLTGVGTGLSENLSAPDIAKRTGISTLIGAGLGAGIGTVMPRVAGAPTPGQRAAQTASELGAPIPRGLASDSAVTNATTAKMRSIPIVGSRISSAVNRTQEAAGERIGEISQGMAGGALDRASSDAIVRPGIEQAIQSNHGAIDAAYNGVRGAIDQNARFTMPRTKAILDAIEATRREAGRVNPSEGLQQFRNVSEGATFNGAHRARVDAREAGNPFAQHPGYNAGDYNRLTRAMTADLREMVQAAAHGTPAEKAAALRAFDKAEAQFGELSKRNDFLNGLLNARGEGAISSLLGAAKEKGGNIRLLAQLKNSMPKESFEQIGGLLLHELGQSKATGEFSLSTFVTNLNKVSSDAKRVLFSPEHLRDIENIGQLGQHIKGALRESNTSHTAGALILLDTARDAIMLGIGVGTGAVSAAGAVSGGLMAAPGVILAHWLASPAKAAAMSNWVKAYRAVTLDQPTPARIAAFKIATRNLSTNLGVPVERIMQRTREAVLPDVRPAGAEGENRKGDRGASQQRNQGEQGQP